MEPFASVNDIETIWRPLSSAETQRAGALLPLISDTLRQAARNVGKDLDANAEDGVYKTVLMGVTVDVAARMLLTSTTDEPLTQFSQGAGGYTVSGTYLVPGGGLFIKRDELKRLGLRVSQKISMIDLCTERLP